jgi:hypothetical protein
VKTIFRWLIVCGIILFISAVANAVKTGITIIIFLIVGAILSKSMNGEEDVVSTGKM